MSIPIQVRRLSRVRQKVRSDLWPEVPQIPEEMTRRFTEFRKFNQDLKLWSERLKNLWEFEPETTEEVCPD